MAQKKIKVFGVQWRGSKVHDVDVDNIASAGSPSSSMEQTIIAMALHILGDALQSCSNAPPCALITA